MLLLSMVSGCSRENLWESVNTRYDAVPPLIQGVSVSNGQSGVAVTAGFSIVPDSPLNPASINADTVQLLDSSDLIVPCSRSYQSNTIQLVPQTNLLRGASYRIIIKDLVDLYGNVMTNIVAVGFTAASALQPPVITLTGGSFLHHSEQLVVHFSEPVTVDGGWQVTIGGQTNRTVSAADSDVSWDGGSSVLTVPLYCDWTPVGAAQFDRITVDVTDFTALEDGSPMVTAAQTVLELPLAWQTFSWDQVPVGGILAPRFMPGSSQVRIISLKTTGELLVNVLSGGDVLVEETLDRLPGAPVAVIKGRVATVSSNENRLTVYEPASQTSLPFDSTVLPDGSVDALAMTQADDGLYLAWIKDTNAVPNSVAIAVYSNSGWHSVTNLSNSSGFKGVQLDSSGKTVYCAAWPNIDETANYLLFSKNEKTYSKEEGQLFATVPSDLQMRVLSDGSVLIAAIINGSELHLQRYSSGSWSGVSNVYPSVSHLSGIADDGTRCVVQAYIEGAMQTVGYDPGGNALIQLPWSKVRTAATVSGGDLLSLNGVWYSVFGVQNSGDLTFSLSRH